MKGKTAVLVQAAMLLPEHIAQRQTPELGVGFLTRCEVGLGKEGWEQRLIKTREGVPTLLE